MKRKTKQKKVTVEIRLDKGQLKYLERVAVICEQSVETVINVILAIQVAALGRPPPIAPEAKP